MSGASHKAKNPLLSAAGEGFLFENYTENALLMPVTSATPAVLRNDAELNNFAGQEAASSPNSTASATVADVDSEFTPIPLHPEETNSPTNQPAKQGGYLTSILSSLPNLSLSSITGDTSGSQVNQGLENVTGVQSTNPYVPSHDRHDSLRDTSPPIVANFHDPRRTNFSGSTEINPGSTGSLSTSLQPPLPPTVPSSTNGPISYRLGNQRRLKYAPPPDIISNTSKQYSVPVVQSLLVPQSTATPTIFSPNEPVASIPNYQPFEAPISTNSPSIQHSTPECLSQANSLQESFRSSPVTTAIPYSSTATSRSATPQNQNSSYESVPTIERPNIPVSFPQPIPSQVLEPSTPQNTPATNSFFAFDAYAGQRGFPPPPKTFNSDREITEAKNNSQQVDLLLPTSTDNLKSSSERKPSVTFAPVSAVQVSEKLEHLLIEQKEDLLGLSTETQSEESTAENKSLTTAEAFDDIKLDDAEGTSESSKPDALSDAFLKQETPESTITQTTYAGNLDAPPSHGVSSNVQPSQQYFQPPPFASSANFFAGKPAEQRSNLNYVPASETSVPSSFSDTSANFAQSPSTFFNTLDSNPSFPLFQYKENTNPSVDLVPPRNDPQQVPLNSSISFNTVSPSISVPQSQLYSNQTSEIASVTCTASDPLPPPPLFYNPNFLSQNEFSIYPSVSDLYTSPVGSQTVNQGQHYFDHFAEPTQRHDIAGGIGSGYFPTSPVMTTVPEPTGSATLNPVQMSINPLAGRTPTDASPTAQTVTTGPSEKRMQYRGVYHHWFYRKEVEHKVLWHPFSMQDSFRLEEVHNSSEITPETTVATDGGRYDVDILRRLRSPVYWSGPSTEVRRCSWFFKGHTESRYVPYDESIAAKLEEEYKQACLTNNWNRRIELNNGEYIIVHSATVQIHYITAASPELATSWGNTTGSEDSAYLQGAGSKPRVIKRGVDEFHIEDGEPEKVDHLLFLVHGIGSVCDLKFRSVEEVVDEFRSISLQLVQSHYRTASEQGAVNRIEVLPISWHTTLHSEDTGIDKKLQAITLDSIPKLRHFTNDTLLDILFYTSPVYCQTIMETVGNEINRLHSVFKQRNPNFEGGIYLGGHSLGSLILFDLLCHQKPPTNDNSSENSTETNEEQDEDADPSQPTTANRVLKRRLSKKISYVVGAAGTGQPYIHYPQLQFHPCAFFALGSPIGMFVTIRGIDMLGEDFILPTCPAFFNIFHPFDPVAYRVEALINTDAPKYRPMLIPHHKGRKRMHLELKETMARVGADLKQKVLDSVKNTWNSVYQLTPFHRPDNSALEREIDKVVEEQLQQTPTATDQQTHDDGGAELKIGKLNGGRRIDYVLQEAPFEYINEYIFALTSHVCYWESEDTMLMMLREIYGSTGIQTDTQLPQQTLTIERASPSPSLSSSSAKCDGQLPEVPVMGLDPTAPISDKPIGPPPKSGFVRKS